MVSEDQAEVHRRVGRNLLRYQRVELQLKRLLPLCGIDLSPGGLDVLQTNMDAKKKLLLGQLAREYLRVVTPQADAGKGDLEEQISQFISARNFLVHHFLEGFGDLAAAERREACLSRLDRDYQLAGAVAHQVETALAFVTTSVLTFVKAWSESKPGVLGVQQTLQAFADRMTQDHGIEFEVRGNVLLELLENAMDSISRDFVRADGWTVFNQVGQALRSDHQDLPPGLLLVARQLDQFEFADRPPRPGRGSVWMYRRVAPSRQMEKLTGSR